MELEIAILDAGSKTSKAGFAGDAAPRSTFPTATIEVDGNLLVGKHSIGMRPVKRPIEHGLVCNWDAMTALLRYTFEQELNITEMDTLPVLLTEMALNPKCNREKLTQIMFEDFKIPALYIADTPSLSLFSTGRTTGCVVESGHGVTQVAPIYEGHLLSYALQRCEVAGAEVTDIIANAHPELNDLDLYATIKERYARVAQNFKDESANFQPQIFELPDGNKITLGDELIRSTEAYFDPLISGFNSDGIHAITRSTITRCDSELHLTMYRNILLAGGSTLLPGFADRLDAEMHELVTYTLINIRSQQDGANAAFKGASLLASQSNFLERCISLAEYNEIGPTSAHHFCY